MRVLTHALIILFGTTLPWITVNAEPAGLTLDRAIRVAVSNDPWLTGSVIRREPWRTMPSPSPRCPIHGSA